MKVSREGKPRITFVRTAFGSGYVCRGNGWVAIGDTPVEAYEIWTKKLNRDAG